MPPRSWMICAGTALWATGPAAAQPDLVVATDRQSYRFGEPVWLYVTIANRDAARCAVENPLCSRTATRIEITPPDGGVLRMTGPPSCATTVLQEIPPGDEMLYAFELLEFYGADGPETEPFGMLPTGRYDVRYRTADHASSDVGFEVLPLERTDLSAFHAYVAILAATRADNLREVTSRFRAFVAQYPESPFAAALLCRAGVVSDLFFDSAAAREDFRRLIELFPDSGFVTIAVRHLAFGMDTGGEGIEYLRTVPEELPGTLAARFSQRVLDRLDLAARRGG